MGKTRVVFKTEVYPAMLWPHSRRPERRTIAVLPGMFASFDADPGSERVAFSLPAMAYMAEGGSKGTIAESYVDKLPDASPKESARLELELAAMGYDIEAVPWESVRTPPGERRHARPQ